MGDQLPALGADDPGDRPAPRVSPEDQRLVAALLMLGDQIPPIVDEVLAGQLDQDERRELARVLATIAAELEPAILARLPEDQGDAIGRGAGRAP